MGVIDGPPLHGQFRKEYPLSLVPSKRVCSLPIEFGQFAKCWKEIGWEGDYFSTLYSEAIILHLDFCGRIKFGSLEVKMILKLQFA